MIKISFVLFLLTSFFGFSQDAEEPVYTVVDQEAEFIGGYEQMQLFISQNLKYPVIACVQGKVLMNVTVEQDGSLSNIRVTKGIPDCSECDEEAIKVVRLMPSFKPALKYGTIVRSYLDFPVTFKL